MRCLALTQSTEQRASERGPVTDLAALGADESGGGTCLPRLWFAAWACLCWGCLKWFLAQALFLGLLPEEGWVACWLSSSLLMQFSARVVKAAVPPRRPSCAWLQALPQHLPSHSRWFTPALGAGWTTGAGTGTAPRTQVAPKTSPGWIPTPSMARPFFTSCQIRFHASAFPWLANLPFEIISVMSGTLKKNIPIPL